MIAPISRLSPRLSLVLGLAAGLAAAPAASAQLFGFGGDASRDPKKTIDQARTAKSWIEIAMDPISVLGDLNPLGRYGKASEGIDTAVDHAVEEGFVPAGRVLSGLPASEVARTEPLGSFENVERGWAGWATGAPAPTPTFPVVLNGVRHEVDMPYWLPHGETLHGWKEVLHDGQERAFYGWGEAPEGSKRPYENVYQLKYGTNWIIPAFGKGAFLEAF